MYSLETSLKYSLEVLEVFHEPQDISILLGISHIKSFICEVLSHIVILSINLKGAV